MRAFIQQSGYTLDLTNNIWIRPNYEGIAYTDGNEVETRIASIVQHALDISVLSTELRRHCIDWPSFYHLSGTRANIMRPFEDILEGDVLEIGAGCGAITRYLGECGANVLALEGSPRRAAITRSRTRDLEKVTVLAEKFDQFQCDYQFDVITLIGVLEYANLFISGENPQLVLLERARSLLKPEGKLIIAIENQLGLKYFAGAPEDHLGQPMVGIEGRYRKDQPQTYGRKVLTGILERAGFAAPELLAPFPDYKLPVSILTEEGFANKNFDAAAFAWQSARRDSQLPAYCNFSLELAWPEVFQNELGLDVANSFLIIVSTNAKQLVAKGVLAYHYSVDRIPAYCKETVFICGDGGDICVRYRRLGTLNGNTDKASNSPIRFISPDLGEYVFGKPLSLEFIHVVTKDGWSFDQVARFVWRYLSMVETFAKSANMQVNMASPYAELSGEFFDVIPQNIIVREDGGPSFIDNEWQLAFPIEIGHLLFRSLLPLIDSITRFGRPVSQASMTRYQFINEVFAASGLKLQEGDYTRYIELEADLMQSVTGRSAENFLNWGKDQLLPLFSLNQAVAERDGQIASLNQTVAECDGQLKVQRSGLSAYAEQADKMSAMLADTREELGKAYGQIETQRSELSAYAEQADKMSAMLADISEELGKAYEQIEVQRSGLSAYAEQADKMSAMLAGISEELGKAYGQIEVQRSELDNLKPVCSIVIPTKNAGSIFLKVLDALAQQTLWNRTELIVVDSGSKDDTVTFAKLAGARVVEIQPDEFNHGATRDYGISLANTENIILAVQDAIPADSRMLETLLAPLEEGAVAGVYSRQIPQPDADVLTKRNLNKWLTGRTEREVRSIPHDGWYEALSPMEKYFFCNFDNVCSAIKKSVWQHESFGKVNFGEDVDWAERVLKRGYKIVYEPAAAVIHSHSRPMSYEYNRVYVCHRKLYAMFGLHLVPSLKGIWKSWIHATGGDIVYILKHEDKLILKVKMILKVPILNFLSALGQYRAVRDEIQGVSNPVQGV